MEESSIQVQNIVSRYSPVARATVFHGDRLALLKQIPEGAARLIVTSPPYNIGKKYEKRLQFEHYLEQQEETIKAAHRALADDGSLCWQVGNHVSTDGEIFPIDIFIYQICKKLGMKLRNRIIWCFEHGLHCKNRLSGRYENIVWFTKGDDYVFNLDPIRVPQKYPGKKAFKGPRKGEYTCNPLGKNPGDVWIIPNVKHNHVEKTEHPCQFPIELVERLILAFTNKGDLVIDPYLGVGSAACAALLHKRRAAGADLSAEYLKIARNRIELAAEGKLPRRPLGKLVYVPNPGDTITKRPKELGEGNGHHPYDQTALFA